jgi:hypothetical protein
VSAETTPQDHSPAALDEWLEDWLPLTFARRRDGDRWFSLIEEFDITGMGATPREARDDALSLLSAYLHAHYEDGTPFKETLRPIPRRLKLEIRAGTLLHLVAGKGRAQSAADEERALVPPSALNGAAC